MSCHCNCRLDGKKIIQCENGTTATVNEIVKSYRYRSIKEDDMWIPSICVC